MRSWLIGVLQLTPLSGVLEFRSVLDDLNALGQKDLLNLWRTVSGRDADTVRRYMLDATPALVEQYSSVSGVAAAEYYDSQLPHSTYKASVAPTPPQAQVEGSTRWAMSVLGKDAAASPIDLLAGAFQRLMFQTARETVVWNVNREPGTVYARYASATACYFCQLLATRSVGYATEASAMIVGRGQAGRSRIRGNQEDGEKYHDNCKCLPVAIRGGKSYVPPSYVGKWTEDYDRAHDAAVAAHEGAGAPGLKAIMREWRQLDK